MPDMIIYGITENNLVLPVCPSKSLTRFPRLVFGGFVHVWCFQWIRSECVLFSALETFGQ